MARLRADRGAVLGRLLPAHVRARRAARARGQGVRRRLHRRADQGAARHAERARHSVAVPRSHTRREPRAAAPDEGRRVPGWCVRAAREDRSRVVEHEDARSAALSHPPRAPPPQRRRVEDLPDVRLRASTRGCDRGHHALDLHARVREQPRAVRLGPRQHRPVDPAPAPVRDGAPRPRLHRDVQAQAAHAGHRRARERLGRSAHADDRGHAPARLLAGGAARVLRHDRRREGELVGRHRQARVLPARRSEQDRAARPRRAAPGRGRARRLAGW